MDNSFFDSIKPKIAERLMANSPKCKRTGNKFEGLICPKCGQPEAFCDLDKGMMILCHCNNKCGASTPIKEVYPELFKVDYTSIPKENIAEYYLRNERGLDTSKFKFEQGKVKGKDGIYYPTAKFIIADGVEFHRLIGCPDVKDKTRNFGSISGKVYKAYCEENPSVIYVVEGIFDALSLMLSGKSAIALMGCSNLPKEYYLSDKNKKFIIALDNDPAGHKGIEKHIEFFQEN